MDFIFTDDPLEALLRQERKKFIREKIRSLNSKHALILWLFYYYEKSAIEIAELIKSTPASVRTTLCNTRYKLKEILQEAEI